MKCPACKDTVLAISERNGIEIDYCPDCRGVWLDRGELDKIVEKSREPQERNYGSGHYQQSTSKKYEDYKYKKKKSFLEELFD